MKRALFFAVCLGLALATAAGAQAPSSGAAPRKKRVAVFDFDYATVHANSAAIFGRDIDIGKGVTDLLVTYLVKDGTYSVIERKALDKIMAEQNFSNSDRATPRRRRSSESCSASTPSSSAALPNSATTPRTRALAASAAGSARSASAGSTAKRAKPLSDSTHAS